MAKFKAELVPVPHGGHYVVVPPDAAEAASIRHGARVRGTVDGVPYRSSLMKYSGVFHMGVPKASLAEIGKTTGDRVDVTVELDDAPLSTDENAMAPSHRREHVKHIIEAKKPETRAGRIAGAIEAFEAKAASAAARPPRRAKSSR
jgi:hypothetical protein